MKVGHNSANVEHKTRSTFTDNLHTILLERPKNLLETFLVIRRCRNTQNAYQVPRTKRVGNVEALEVLRGLV